MLRHPRGSLRTLAAAVLAVLLALATPGCGIKGPLLPPPKPEAAKDAPEAAKDAPEAPSSRKP